MFGHNEMRCKDVAENIEKIANGEYYLCPDCFNQFSLDTANFENKDEETFLTCPFCNEKHCENDLEKASLENYLSSAYDYDFICSSKLQYLAVRVYIALGGPSIWINTNNNSIELNWWGETAKWGISDEVCNLIDEYYLGIYHLTERKDRGD